MVVSLLWCGVVQRGSSNWCAGRRAGSHVNQKPGVGLETHKTVPVVCFHETHTGRAWITDKEPNGQKPIAN
jgi:hypothetical protein